ncbi:potassium/sodium hyperpolarization-activated cyclic nucleotide-gated channel 2-like [Cinclus cinclus]|uniref:potassium/sodium hyperpolarization-activated cyclic nucleotide-gated channel 2-like n=1 Tax=Cinclus cinclus TaxID=127875 RepID=UPI002E0D4099
MPLGSRARPPMGTEGRNPFRGDPRRVPGPSRAAPPHPRHPGRAAAARELFFSPQRKNTEGWTRRWGRRHPETPGVPGGARGGGHTRGTPSLCLSPALCATGDASGATHGLRIPRRERERTVRGSGTSRGARGHHGDSEGRVPSSAPPKSPSLRAPFVRGRGPAHTAPFVPPPGPRAGGRSEPLPVPPPRVPRCYSWRRGPRWHAADSGDVPELPAGPRADNARSRRRRGAREGWGGPSIAPHPPPGRCTRGSRRPIPQWDPRSRQSCPEALEGPGGAPGPGRGGAVRACPELRGRPRRGPGPDKAAFDRSPPPPPPLPAPGPESRLPGPGWPRTPRCPRGSRFGGLGSPPPPPSPARHNRGFVRCQGRGPRAQRGFCAPTEQRGGDTEPGTPAGTPRPRSRGCPRGSALGAVAAAGPKSGRAWRGGGAVPEAPALRKPRPAGSGTALREPRGRGRDGTGRGGGGPGAGTALGAVMASSEGTEGHQGVAIEEVTRPP